MEIIHVIAYPKSGSTWLMRLLGDALDCPYGYNEKIHDTGKINNDYYVRHSHYSKNDMPIYFNNSTKIVYIVRDIKDVLVSGFFHHHRINEKFVLKHNDNNNFLLKRLFWRGLVFNLEILKLTRSWGSLSGGDDIKHFLGGIFLSTRWIKDLKFSIVGDWSSHIKYWRGFSDNVIIVKYEELLYDTNNIIIDIFQRFNIKYDTKQIIHAINKNNFDTQKKYYNYINDIKKYKFLRKGKIGDYKRFLNKRQIKTINNIHGETIKILGYK